MTFEQWWEQRYLNLCRRPGNVSKDEAKALCHEAWLIAMDHGQVDDASTEVVVESQNALSRTRPRPQEETENESQAEAEAQNSGAETTN